MIYDESLFRSDTIAIGARDIRGALGLLGALATDTAEVEGLIG